MKRTRVSSHHLRAWIPYRR